MFQRFQGKSWARMMEEHWWHLEGKKHWCLCHFVQVDRPTSQGHSFILVCFALLEFIYTPQMSWPQGGLCMAQIGIILAEGDCNQERCHEISCPASACSIFHSSDTTGCSLIFIFDRNNKRIVPIVPDKNSPFHMCYSTMIAHAICHWSLLETMSLIQDHQYI